MRICGHDLALEGWLEKVRDGSRGVSFWDLCRVIGKPDHDQEYRQIVRLRILKGGADQVEPWWRKFLQGTLAAPANIVLRCLQDGEIGIHSSSRNLSVDLGHEIVTAGRDSYLDLGIFGLELAHKSRINLRRSLQVGRDFTLHGSLCVKRVEIEPLSKRR